MNTDPCGFSQTCVHGSRVEPGMTVWGGSVLLNQRPQPRTHLLDGMRGGLFAGRLEPGIARPRILEQLRNEAAASHLPQNPAHLGSAVGVDHSRSPLQRSELGGVGDRLAHSGDAALVAEIGYQLYLGK